MIISKKTWKLFFPIFLVIIIMMISFYSRELLRYGNRKIYAIDDLVGVLMFIVIGVSVVLILYIIEIYLNNYLQEMEIIKLGKELNQLKKKE